MHPIFKKAVRLALRPGMRVLYWRFRRFIQPNVRRSPLPGETTKARARRTREGFLDRYVVGHGLDIGYGGDPVSSTCHIWDVEHGDAELLQVKKTEEYDYVYSSHTLEHLVNPRKALTNWWRVVKPGGLLILYLPDRDLYEKCKQLPSKWNPDHKWFFLLDRDEPPCTLGVLPLIHKTLRNVEILIARRVSEGHTIDDPNIHSDGEYSIELVVRKRLT